MFNVFSNSVYFPTYGMNFVAYMEYLMVHTGWESYRGYFILFYFILTAGNNLSFPWYKNVYNSKYK